MDRLALLDLLDKRHLLGLLDQVYYFLRNKMINVSSRSWTTGTPWTGWTTWEARTSWSPRVSSFPDDLFLMSFFLGLMGYPATMGILEDLDQKETRVLKDTLGLSASQALEESRGTLAKGGNKGTRETKEKLVTLFT